MQRHAARGVRPQATIRNAVLAATGLALFYIAVVGGLGGFAHLPRQAWQDAPWLILILVGFGTQVALYIELRRRRRLAAGIGAVAGTGGGASAVGMVACCAHHLPELAPLGLAARPIIRRLTGHDANRSLGLNER